MNNIMQDNKYSLFQIPYTNKYTNVEKEKLYKEAYKDYLPLIRMEKDFLNSAFDFFCRRHIDKIFISHISSKIKIFELEDSFKKEINSYLKSMLFLTFEERKNYLKDFSRKITLEYFYLFPEDDILKPVFNEFLYCFRSDFRMKFKNPYLPNFIGILLEYELSLIGSFIKELVSKETSRKVNSIIENTIHIVTSSSSDKIGNYLNSIEQSFYLNKKIQRSLFDIKNAESCSICNTDIIFKTLEIAKKTEDSFGELIDFFQKQSRMFRSFKNEIKNSCNKDDLDFTMKFVFKNGFKIKYNHVNVNIVNKLKEDSVFLLNEYILINSMYVLFENAIEAEAKTINIFLEESKDSVQVLVENDGVRVDMRVVPSIFDKCFTTKRNHAGIGLDIAKKWLNNVGYGLEYCNVKQLFIIKIPKEKNERNNSGR